MCDVVLTRQDSFPALVRRESRQNFAVSETRNPKFPKGRNTLPPAAVLANLKTRHSPTVR